MAHEYTIGVEEEYQIVGGASRALKPRSDDILPDAEEELGDKVGHELYLSQIEIGTPICHSLDDVRREIITARRAVIESARASNSDIAAAGTHPFSHWDDQDLTPKERYLDMQEDYQQLVREHIICGCHVHIGVPDPSSAIDVLNRARSYLHVLIALAGNSPFWLGEDTGYSSYRTEVWRRWPMAGSPHPFSGRAEYDALVKALVDSGSISDETKIYWDIRPADRFGTIEFRATDVCLSVDEAVLMAGLCRALARHALESAASDALTFVPTRPELLRAAEWRAARYGLDGDLVDVKTGTARPAHEMVLELRDTLRPALEANSDWDTVATLLDELLARGNGAARQRAVYAKTGDFKDVVNFVVEETARGVV